MNQEHLEMLESVRDVMEEIKELEQDLNITDPARYLERLTEIRNTLEEVRDLKEETDA